MMAEIQKSPIQVDNFHQWSKDQFYRTSYSNQYRNVPEEPKNVSIPGYAGFMPSVQSSSLYGKGYAAISRQAFANPKLGLNPFHMATTGFNFNPRVHIDASQRGKSHTYGNQTIPKNHPCLQQIQWESQQQADFRHPRSLPNPTYHQTNKFTETTKQMTKTSGFQQNHSVQDGTGWVPEKVLGSDMMRTEYRNEFNSEKPFQQETTRFKVRKLPKQQMNHKNT